MSAVNGLERIAIQKRDRIDAESLWSLVSAAPFKRRVQEAVTRTRIENKEVAFFALKEFEKRTVSLSNIKVGRKTKVNVECLGDMCFDADEMRYVRYPLISFHTHTGHDCPVPSGPDFMSLSNGPREWATREYYKVRPILWISSLPKDGVVESLLIQDKTCILEAVMYVDNAKLGGYTSGAMVKLEKEIYKLRKAKRLSLEIVADMFADAGFVTAAFRNEEELKPLLPRFEFNEVNRAKNAHRHNFEQYTQMVDQTEKEDEEFSVPFF